MDSPSELTSKYSTPLKGATIAFGNVIWFLTVFLTSISFLTINHATQAFGTERSQFL